MNKLILIKKKGTKECMRNSKSVYGFDYENNHRELLSISDYS